MESYAQSEAKLVSQLEMGEMVQTPLINGATSYSSIYFANRTFFPGLHEK